MRTALSFEGEATGNLVSLCPGTRAMAQSCRYRRTHKVAKTINSLRLREREFF